MSCLAVFLLFFWKAWSTVNRFSMRCNIYHSPLSQYADTDFPHSRTYRLHWLPVGRLNAVLDRPEFEARGTTSIIREIPEIIETGPCKNKFLNRHGDII